MNSTKGISRREGKDSDDDDDSKWDEQNDIINEFKLLFLVCVKLICCLKDSLWQHGTIVTDTKVSLVTAAGWLATSTAIWQCWQGRSEKQRSERGRRSCLAIKERKLQKYFFLLSRAPLDVFGRLVFSSYTMVIHRLLCLFRSRSLSQPPEITILFSPVVSLYILARLLSIVKSWRKGGKRVRRAVMTATQQWQKRFMQT